MKITSFEIFKEKLTKLFVFLPEPRPDWEEWMHDWYVEFKQSVWNNDELEMWAEEWFEPTTLKTHSYMLKTKAIRERDELKQAGLLDVKNLIPIINRRSSN